MAFIGAYLDDDACPPEPPDDCDTGSAYVFRGLSDCNTNGVLDLRDIEECDESAWCEDCNQNGAPDVCDPDLGPTIKVQPEDVRACTGDDACFTVEANGSGTLEYHWFVNGGPEGQDSPELCLEEVQLEDDGAVVICQVTDACGTVVSEPATLTVQTYALPDHFVAGPICEPETIPAPGLLSFSYDGLAPEFGCDGSIASRLFAGRLGCEGPCKITRITQDCAINPFGSLLCRPESVLVDTNSYWPGACGEPNLIIVGGCCDDDQLDHIYFLHPINGSICEEYVDDFGCIGQMALNSMGWLYIGSLEHDCPYVLHDGVVEACDGGCCPGQSPRAVAVDENDNVYVTCSGDGIMRKLTPDCTPIDASFAAGLEGAVSQAVAPEGIFHGNIFVACGDRVMEVDLETGETTEFFQCSEAHGIAFDPEGYMYVSGPSEERILTIGPALPGDMNGDAVVNMDDLAGFVAALIRLPDAPLPIMTADMNGDGCANGNDIQPFVDILIGS